METSFLSGSENLYKYLVSIGLLLIVLTVFYPLKEKQNLEVSKITIEKEALLLNYKIKEISKSVENIKLKIKSLNKKDLIDSNLNKIDDLFQHSQISQIELEQKYKEIDIRKKHIKLYNILFCIFFPIGVVITIFGFYKWLKSKTVDDEILELEKKKLELEIDKLGSEYNTNPKTMLKGNGDENDSTKER